ncbi:hypothetical protein AAFF_G00393960 [Aldrovandia affinis]|uniref:Uncharacterized protein n=1 Tax=Aldrovandia affinis TaxID=143900 RepID=A0AAD7SE55_9TELE|nr:hypothetical protein AAFF_G00393960 [Aldrovandia affinis]
MDGRFGNCVCDLLRISLSYCLRLTQSGPMLQMRMEAIGLLREVPKPAFMFISYLVQKVLMFLDVPNKLLQGEDMDLLRGLELVASGTECVSKLRCEAE